MIQDDYLSRYVTEVTPPPIPKGRVVCRRISLVTGILGSISCIGLLAYLGTQCIPTQSGIAVLCLISIVVTIVTVCLLVIVAWRYRRKPESRQSQLISPTLVLLTVASGLTLASAILLQTMPTSSTTIPEDIPKLSGALIGVDALAAISQVSYIMLIVFGKSCVQPEINQIHLPAKSTKKAWTASDRTLNSFRSNRLSNSLCAATQRLSWTGIASTTIASRRESRANRKNKIDQRRSQAEIQWDTSGVPESLREAVHRNASTILVTIPGSRRGSIASTTNGSEGGLLSLSRNISQPVSPIDVSFSRQLSIDTNSDYISPFKPPRPHFARAGTATVPASPSGSFHKLSRSSSTVSLVESVSHLAPSVGGESAEANIHPLFRSTCSNPVVGVSKNTIVTAASVCDAEEVAINSHSRAVSRANSRPTSPLANQSEFGPLIFEKTESTAITAVEPIEEEPTEQSDVIILPVLPRTSISSRARGSTISIATLTTPPSSPCRSESFAETIARVSSRCDDTSREGLVPGSVSAARNSKRVLDHIGRVGSCGPADSTLKSPRPPS